MIARLWKPFKYRAKAWVLARSPGSYWGTRRLLRGPFEPECRLLAHWCRPGTLALDVGANWGAWTYELSRLVGHVHAFEPNPHLADNLERSFAGANVTVHRCAVSDAKGSATLRVPRLNLGYSTIEPANQLGRKVVGATAIDTYEVPIQRIDDLGLETLSFIKIDVEGHEVAAIEGALATIARDRPTLVVESESRHNPDAPARTIALLRPLGYRVSKLVKGRQVEIAAGQDPETVPGRNLIFEP